MLKFKRKDAVILKKDINKQNPDVYLIYGGLKNNNGYVYKHQREYYNLGCRYILLKVNKIGDLYNSLSVIYVKEDEIVLYDEGKFIKPLIEPKDYKYKIGDYIIVRTTPSNDPIDYEYDLYGMIVGYVKDCSYLTESTKKYLVSIGIIYLVVFISTDCGDGKADSGKHILFEEQCIPYIPNEEYDYILKEGKEDYEKHYKDEELIYIY